MYKPVSQQHRWVEGINLEMRIRPPSKQSEQAGVVEAGRMGTDVLLIHTWMASRLSPGTEKDRQDLGRTRISSSLGGNHSAQAQEPERVWQWGGGRGGH